MYDGGPTFMTGSAICAIDTRFVHHALPAKNVPPYPPPAKSRNRPFKPLGLQFAANTCARIPPVIQPGHSSLPPQGKPGFHAEWLRDGPCDATTTCLGKPGVWCQLSLASAGNMRFGGRFSTLSRGASHGFSSPITFALNRAGHAPAYPLSLSQTFARDE
jgi:hypothetical protein